MWAWVGGVLGRLYSSRYWFQLKSKTIKGHIKGLNLYNKIQFGAYEKKVYDQFERINSLTLRLGTKQMKKSTASINFYLPTNGNS